MTAAADMGRIIKEAANLSDMGAGQVGRIWLIRKRRTKT